MVLDNVLAFVVNPIIYLLSGIAVVVFLWGAVEFIANADNPEARTEGQKHLMWGIVGLGIIFGAYGILNFIQGTILGLIS